MAKAQPPKDIDEYIARFPAEVRGILAKVRATIRMAAPEAKETISYQMPAFKQHGILVYFAGWKEHIGLYPPVSGDIALVKAVARYAGPKGNLQFPLAEPIPYALIKRVVKLRVKQDSEKAATKRKKGK
ncbi:MAG: iron chaperone [Pirellulaceae bacterium]